MPRFHARETFGAVVGLMLRVISLGRRGATEFDAAPSIDSVSLAAASLAAAATAATAALASFDSLDISPPPIDSRRVLIAS